MIKRLSRNDILVNIEIVLQVVCMVCTGIINCLQLQCHDKDTLITRHATVTHLLVKIKVGLSWANFDEIGQEYVWIAYIPIFSSIGAMEPPSQWGSSFEPFYIVKSWFLAIFGRNFKALLVGLVSSGVWHMNTWPVNSF